MNIGSFKSAAGVWCLASGLAREPIRGGLGRDILVAHGPESRHHTPSATRVRTEHFKCNAIGVSRAGVGIGCQDRERQGSRDRVYTDVLATSPGSQYPPWLLTLDRLSGSAMGQVHFFENEPDPIF